MAGNSTISITFKLDGDGKGFKMLAADADGFKKAVTDAITEAEKLNTNAINFAAISTAVDQAQNALNRLQGELKGFADAYAVQETVETKLATAMRNTMGARDSEIQSIKDLCSAQQDLGVIGDEVQLAGAQELATYLTMTDTLKTLIPVMNDMVAQQYGLEASGESATQIATMLGKVMNGQVNALSRYGYTFDEAQEQILKFGTESERAAVLAEVVGQSVGGMNQALAQTDSGKQKQLENTLGDIKEKLGGLTNAALPFVTMAANSMIALGGVVKLYGGIKTASAAMAAWNIKGTATAAMCKLVGVSSTKSGAMVRVFSSAMKGGAYSATAMKLALRGLMMASGVGIAIAALTAIVEYFVNATDEATDSTNELIDAEKRAEREAQYLEQLHQQETSALENTRAALAINISKLKEFNGSKAEEKKLVDEMNNTYGETMGYFSSVSDWYNTLITNSETYCKQMVLEARTRMLANQIAQKQQENYEITHNEDGSKRKYSTKRETKTKGNVSSGAIYAMPGAAAESHKSVHQEEIPGTSDLDKAQAAYDANNASIKNLTTQLDAAAAEIAGLDFSVRGSATPTGGGDGGNKPATKPATKENPLWKDDAATLKEIGDNIKILQEQLQNASIEEAAEINQQIALWQGKADAIRNAGKAVEDNGPKWKDDAVNFGEISDNITILQKRLQTATVDEAAEINQQIALWQAKADAIRNAGKAVEEEKKPQFKADAAALKDINTNIDILTEQLQTATIEEAALINRQIELWDKKAEAIKNAGKETKATFGTFKSGWGAVKNIDSAVENMTETLKGNGTVWEKTIAIVDCFISLHDGIEAIAGVIKVLTAASEAHTVAKTAETAATVASTTATGAAAAEAPVAAAAEVPLIAANKLATASFLELAAASYFSAHAHIPFAGFAIASGFATGATAMTKSIGVMAFADGGIAYGPTLGLFAEYAGASHNPEVVAPLDKLRGMLQPTGGMGGEVTFKISGENLVGVLNRRNNHIKRTI